jgi:hypothetical protein
VQVGELAREMGFQQVSLSAEVMPMVKMVPRGFTTAADAYLTPHILRYLATFQSGFDAGLSQVQLGFMQSDGGLSPLQTFSGHKAKPPLHETLFYAFRVSLHRSLCRPFALSLAAPLHNVLARFFPRPYSVSGDIHGSMATARKGASQFLEHAV